MRMSETKIDFERIPGLEHVVRVPVETYRESQTLLDVIEATLDSCLKNGDSRIILDLKNIRYPSTRLSTILVEATSRARRAKGELKIINLDPKVRQSLSDFSPEAYLAIEADEAQALHHFGELPPPKPEQIIPAARMPEEEPKPDIPDEESDIDLAPVDIVEDPIIEKLGDSVEKDGESTKPAQRLRNHLRVSSEARNLYEICDFVTKYAEKAGFDSKDVGKTKIAVYEACLNVVEHAYHSNPDNHIDIWVEYDAEKLVIEIKDYGRGFEGFSDKSYDVFSAMDGRQTGGFGLYIIRRSMDELEYRASEVDGNLLRMVKYLNSKA